MAIAEPMTSMGYFTRIILLASATITVAVSAMAQAGAPSSIQIFMPSGGLPDRSMRLELTRDDGRIETVFTDTKGKFLITGDLVRDAEYAVRVESDGRTFARTVVTFRTFRNIVTYVPVFLNPIEGKQRPVPMVLNVIDVKVPTEARNIYEHAVQKAGKGDTTDAIADLKRSLTIYPRYVRALNDLGVLYLHRNQLREAEDAFRQAIKLNESYIYPRLNLGIVLNRQGRFAEAAAVLEKIEQEHSGIPAARLPYADALAGIGKTAEAERLLRSLFAEPSLSDSAKAQAHFRLGAILNKQSRFAEAAAEFAEAIKLEPNAVMAHLQLGGALIQLKRLAEAERELLKAYELGGRAAGAAQFLLGQVYNLQTKYELAVAAFEQYLKDVPSAPNAAEVVEAIERIKLALKPK
jgi:tetratricopeptide (TPR) repeat protein